MNDTRSVYARLFDVYVPVGLAVFAIVVIAIVVAVLRGRARARRDDASPEANSSTPVEVSYVVLITLIVAGLLAFTYTQMSDLSAAERSARGPRVNVIAAKWNWRFDYPDYRISEVAPGGAIATLYVPVDTDVRFRLTAADVIHAFWVPDRRFKRDAFPGRTTAFTLRFPDEGFHRSAGECAQFCGLDHARMDFNVNVLGKSEFRDWVRRRRAEASG
jgi:cytochrome c oxidase subunit 2